MSYVPDDQEVHSNISDASTSLLSPGSITILVVDDHALIRSAISQALSQQAQVRLVATASDYVGAEEQLTQLRPELIWLDLHIASSHGIAEIPRLRRVAPNLRILALADEENEEEAFAAIMAGAQGYRSKQDVDADEIMEMISRLCRGEFILRPTLLARLLQRLRAAALPLWGSENARGPGAHTVKNHFDGLTQLTTREREILQLISQGYRDRDIAEGLHISEKTVQKHVQSILNKLGAQNRTEAAYVIHRQFMPM